MKRIALSALSYLVVSLFITGCKSESAFDASGTFEAIETIISSEASGILNEFNLEEGQVLKANQFIGYIDSTQVFLKKELLEAQMKSLLAKKPNISTQLAALESQLKTAQDEKKRVENLVKSKAVPTKQLDDINAQIDVLRKQIDAAYSSLSITSNGIDMDAKSINIQIKQLEDQLIKHRIVCRKAGTVITKYAEQYEMTAVGKPLYKMADLGNIILKVYVTGNQLPLIKLNQQVKVYTDNGEGGFKETTGEITWISDKAEFTPKNVQTKDERANKVYAVKVKVKNDGTYKIGMYGEIKFE